MQTTSSPSTTNNAQSTVDAKILADLNVLKEKMELCEKMLHPGDGSPAPSLKNNETMLTVIGFLEACAPRMVELVEAGAQGALSEAVLMDTLEVNDSLQKLLADIETDAFTETAASTTAASAPSVEEQLDDLLLDDSNTSNDVVPSPTGKTTGDDDPFADLTAGKSTGQDDPFADLMSGKTAGQDDPFANEVLTPTTAAPVGKTSGDEPKLAPEDDFDAFFEERTKNK
jgi:hypothetical protein